jgi:nucleotide-binding universal stress UspA family protein
MALKKVLLAYDGSEGSGKAVDWALAFAGQTGVETRVVRVADLPTEVISEIPGILATLRQDIETSQGSILRRFAANGLLATSVILEGAPAFELLQYALQEKVDLIICGSRGLGGFESLLLGSVAHQLVTHSSLPVIVVK